MQFCGMGKPWQRKMRQPLNLHTVGFEKQGAGLSESACPRENKQGNNRNNLNVSDCIINAPEKNYYSILGGYSCVVYFYWFCLNATVFPCSSTRPLISSLIGHALKTNINKQNKHFLVYIALLYYYKFGKIEEKFDICI